MHSVALFFFAGDFGEVIMRHVEGRPQVYGTHGEVAELALSLVKSGLTVTIYSLWNEIARVREVHGVRIVDVGDKGFDFAKMTRVAEPADALVVHYPDPTLLRWAIGTGKRIFAGMANSDNLNTPRRLYRRWRLVKLLNHPSVEMVANHCRPATEQYRRFGVNPGKLVAWDIPRSFSPSQYAPKSLRLGQPLTIAYAGSDSPQKGLPDLLEALRVVRRTTDVRLRIAGGNGASQDGVEWLGVIPNCDVIKLFRESDFVAVPSRKEFPEGFPLVMFEAIASRTPIICSDHPIFRPVMNGVATMFRSGSASDLAHKIVQATQSPSRYWRMSRDADVAWSRLDGTMNWRAMIHAWLNRENHKLSPYLIAQHPICASG